MIKTFQRYELKYLIDKTQFQKLLPLLKEQMNFDKFCKGDKNYNIYNIYFDNSKNEIIQKSLSKPFYKEKLRLRSYEVPTESTTVFLELKKKIGNSVIKRRAVMKYNQALDFLKNKDTSMFKGLDKIVLEEIKKHIDRYNVKPKVNIQYERIAFFDKTDEDIRVSFDNNIFTSRELLNMEKLEKESNLLDENKFIMEIKCKGAIPIWLCKILSNLKIYKTSFSKYGNEYKKFINNKALSI